jgi:hypothetical protein
MNPEAIQLQDFERGLGGDCAPELRHSKRAKTSKAYI